VARSLRWIPWVGLTAAVTAVDLTVRVAIPFDLTRVLVIETALFLATALTMTWMASRAPANRRWLRVLQWMLVWSFALAAVRSAIWVSGQPVVRANITVLALGAAVLASVLLRRRRDRTRGRREGAP
jgi:hypothetical protein